MDISILLALQNIRNGAGGIFAEFLLKMTFFGEMNTVLILMSVIYWSVSKEFGTWLLMGWSGIRVVNGFLKVTACVYRPWIRDPRILPYGDSMTTATGYSFPSGHSMNAASLYGGGAVRKDLPKPLRLFLGIILALVAFSRIYLGVHAPQDILAGTAAGLLVMWLIFRLTLYLKKHPEKDIMVLLPALGLRVPWLYLPPSNPIRKILTRQASCWWTEQKWKSIPSEESAGAWGFLRDGSLRGGISAFLRIFP